MKLSQTLLLDVPSHLIPSLVPSGMSMSSSNPERDLEDGCSLDMVPDRVAKNIASCILTAGRLLPKSYLTDGFTWMTIWIWVQYVHILSIYSCLTLFPSIGYHFVIYLPFFLYLRVFALNQGNPTGIGWITLEIHGRFGSSKFGCQPISNFRFTKLITIFQFGKRNEKSIKY